MLHWGQAGLIVLSVGEWRGRRGGGLLGQLMLAAGLCKNGFCDWLLFDPCAVAEGARTVWRHCTLQLTRQRTPLCYALDCYCPASIIAALLRAGADRNHNFTEDGKTYTPATYAQKLGNQQLWNEALQLADAAAVSAADASGCMAS